MENKYLTRNNAYKKREPFRDAKKVYIYCEGEVREIEYFKYFRYLSSNINIIPIPNKGGKSDPLKLLEQFKKDFEGSSDTSPKYVLDTEQNDEVWFVIDTDQWNTGDKINKLRRFCSEKDEEKIHCWQVAQSNPCFEIWLYYHFFDKKPSKKEVESHKGMKDFVTHSIPGGFDSRSMPVEIETAICNSEKNFSRSDNGQPDKYCTELHILGKTILPFIKDQLSEIKKETL